MNKYFIFLSVLILGLVGTTAEAKEKNVVDSKNSEQIFTDDERNLSFTYNQKKPFLASKTKTVDGVATDGFRFRSGKKIAMTMIYYDETEEFLAVNTLINKTLSDHGKSDADGNKFSVKQRKIHNPTMFGGVDLLNVTITSPKKKMSGVKYYVAIPKPDMLVTMTSVWGSKSVSSPVTGNVRVNGKNEKFEPYFKTEKEADKFMSQIVTSLRVD